MNPAGRTALLWCNRAYGPRMSSTIAFLTIRCLRWLQKPRLRVLARCERGDHGRTKDLVGPWTLAEFGECTFEQQSILRLFLFLFSYAVDSRSHRSSLKTWQRDWK